MVLQREFGKIFTIENRSQQRLQPNKRRKKISFFRNDNIIIIITRYGCRVNFATFRKQCITNKRKLARELYFNRVCVYIFYALFIDCLAVQFKLNIVVNYIFEFQGRKAHRIIFIVRRTTFTVVVCCTHKFYFIALLGP